MPNNSLGLVLAAIFVLLPGCAEPPEIDRMNRQWVEEFQSSFPSGQSLNDLHSWLRERNVFYTFEDSDIVDGNWQVTVDHIHPDAFHCESASVVLIVTIDESHNVGAWHLAFENDCFLSTADAT